MAIAFSNLTSGGDTTNNPASTASVSPTAGAVVFLAAGVAVQGGDSMNVSDSLAVSGCGLTWTEIAKVADTSNRRRLFVWRGTGTPSSGAISMTFTSGAGATWTETAWSVDQATGVDGTTPVSNEATNFGSSTGLEVTVSGTPDAGDFVYAAFTIESTGTSPTLNGELSNQLALYDAGTDVRALLAAYDSSPDSTPVPGITWTGTNYANGIAFIVNAAAGGSNTDYSPGVGTAVISAFGPLVNPQFASPSADAIDGNWTPSTGSDLYACIDETLRSDTDYIQSGTNPSSDSCTIKLGTLNDPGTDDGFHLQYAAGAIGTTGQVVVSLRQGNSPGTEIAAWTHTNLPVGSYQEFDDPVTSTQAANITDYADLYLRIVAS